MPPSTRKSADNNPQSWTRRLALRSQEASVKAGVHVSGGRTAAERAAHSISAMAAVQAHRRTGAGLGASPVAMVPVVVRGLTRVGVPPESRRFGRRLLVSD